MIFRFCELAFGKAVADALALAEEVSSLDGEPGGAGLRGSLLLGVSAFDFLVHEIVRVECVRTAKAGKVLDTALPGYMAILPHEIFCKELDLLIRSKNSTKAFVSSKNIKEAFLPIYKNFWGEYESITGRKKDDVCSEIDSIWRWRNRIAHEGDFIPSGMSFVNWPIFLDDVREKIEFLNNVGLDLLSMSRARVV